MQTLTENHLNMVTAGAGDSLAKDIGQFLGGGTGWIRANLGLYLFLGGGIGGLAAAYAGFREAME